MLRDDEDDEDEELLNDDEISDENDEDEEDGDSSADIFDKITLPSTSSAQVYKKRKEMKNSEDEKKTTATAASNEKKGADFENENENEEEDKQDEYEDGNNVTVFNTKKYPSKRKLKIFTTNNKRKKISINLLQFIKTFMEFVKRYNENANFLTNLTLTLDDIKMFVSQVYEKNLFEDEKKNLKIYNMTITYFINAQYDLQFSKEYLKFFISTYYPYIDGSILCKSSEDKEMKKIKSQKQTSKPAQENVLYQFVKNYTNIESAINNCSSIYLRTFQNILQNNIRFPKFYIYDLPKFREISDIKSINDETEIEDKDKYIKMAIISTPVRFLLLISNSCILINENKYFKLLPFKLVHLEDQFSSSHLHFLNEDLDSYIILDVIMNTGNKVKIIDIIELKHKNYTLDENYLNRINFLKKYLCEKDFIEKFKGVNSLWISKKGINKTMYYCDKPKHVVAVVGLYDKQLIGAYMNNDNKLICKFVSPIPKLCSFNLLIMESYSIENKNDIKILLNDKEVDVLGLADFVFDNNNLFMFKKAVLIYVSPRETLKRLITIANDASEISHASLFKQHQIRYNEIKQENMKGLNANELIRQLPSNLKKSLFHLLYNEYQNELEEQKNITITLNQ